MMHVAAKLFRQIPIPLSGRWVGLLILAALQWGCYVYTTYDVPPLDDELKRLDPKGVVEIYWRSALKGDTETIKRIVGRPGDSVLWDCPHKQIASDSKGTMNENQSPGEKEIELMFKEPIDRLESILLKARVFEIAGKALETDYDLAEYKSFGSEARLLYRHRESPNSTTSTVFFLLNDSQRWRLVDIRSENHLQFVGNKKFGEARECPPQE